MRDLLRPAELQLFETLQGRERRHALDMLAWLRAHTTPSEELLVATLLHNTGKGPLYVHERILHVLLLQFAPRLHARLAGHGRGRLARALAAQRDHPARGAARLAALGCPPRVCELVRRHHDASPGDDRELAWLMAADRVC